MARDRPTNAAVVRMLEQISRELVEVKKQQADMKTRLDEIYKGVNR